MKYVVVVLWFLAMRSICLSACPHLPPIWTIPLPSGCRRSSTCFCAVRPAETLYRYSSGGWAMRRLSGRRELAGAWVGRGPLLREAGEGPNGPIL